MPAAPKTKAKLGLGENIEEQEKRQEWTLRREEAEGKKTAPEQRRTESIKGGKKSKKE